MFIEEILAHLQFAGGIASDHILAQRIPSKDRYTISHLINSTKTIINKSPSSSFHQNQNDDELQIHWSNTKSLIESLIVR